MAIACAAASLSPASISYSSSSSASAGPPRLGTAARFPPLSFAPSALRLHLPGDTSPRSSTTGRFFASSASPATVAASTISVGEKLPESTLSYLGPDGEVKTVTVSELTSGRKAVIFAVPGAFTPTCSQKHLPGFVEKAAELRSKGVETIACVSVNDVFVMRAWKEKLGVGDEEVLLLSDGNGEFTRALGVELDLRGNPVGLGVRSRRYAMLAEDGVVKLLNLEEGGAFTFSSADDILKSL